MHIQILKKIMPEASHGVGAQATVKANDNEVKGSTLIRRNEIFDIFISLF